MVEMGHKDTGLPIETLGPSHDRSMFISLNDLIGWPDKTGQNYLLYREGQGLQPHNPLRCAPVEHKYLRSNFIKVTEILSGFNLHRSKLMDAN